VPYDVTDRRFAVRFAVEAKYFSFLYYILSDTEAFLACTQ